MLAVRATRAFDGERVIEGGVTLLMDGPTIVGLAAPGDRVPDGTAIVDHGEATILPGLIDAHVHLCGDSLTGALDRLDIYDDAQLADVIETGLKRQLAAGVTTVRDLGDRRYVVVDRRETTGPAVLPTIVASGPPITSVRGHCWNMGGEAAGPDGLRRAVRERAERGVDVIKIMASGGLWTKGTDVTAMQFSDDDLQVVVDEAHALGLPVTAHAHAQSAVLQAAGAGVDGIEHCSCMTASGLEAPAELIDLLAAGQIAVCPTLGADPDVPLPPAVLELQSRLGIDHGDRLLLVTRLHASGVRLVAGSDAGISTGKPHGILTETLVDTSVCMPTLDALASATSVAAHVCGLEGRKGRLRPGHDADVVVVAGNPVIDMTDLRQIRQVILAGTIVDSGLVQT